VSRAVKFGETVVSPFFFLSGSPLFGRQGGIVRKYLGVAVFAAALSVLLPAQVSAQTQSPAQAPTPTPAQGQSSDQASQTQTSQAPQATPIPAGPQGPAVKAAPEYPRIELFGGGTYGLTGFFNAGHWAALHGWDASLGANATPWLGFLVEGGEFFGTSQIPTTVPAPFPFPPCQPDCTSSTFGASTREYNFLLGAQFTRRKYRLWTPFAELLYGHQGVRGQASNFVAGPLDVQVGTGRAFEAGVGADHAISKRFAIRCKVDYLATGTNFSLLGKQSQSNFRVSVGIVIRNVKKKKRTLEEDTDITP
jgi:hypothetical protein